MAKNSRVPDAVGSIPLLGDLVKRADSQAQWMQELLEQNTRLLAQLPSTMRSFNDSLERFNQTVGRLDRAVGRIESATAQVTAPLEQVGPRLERIVSSLDVPSLRDVPELVDVLRREAVPAMRAAADTQKQLALLAATLDRILAVLNELPGAGVVRRFTGRAEADVNPPREDRRPSR